MVYFYDSNTMRDMVYKNVIEKDTIKKWIDEKTTVNYYNIPCAFDIETTSFYEKDGKVSKTKLDDTWNERACMYEWTLGIDEDIIIGREWEDAIEAFNIISELALGTTNRIVIYVQNLAFEFQFLSRRMSWDSVFSLDSHKPVKAVAKCGIEFRCSYILSGYSLAVIGRNLNKYHCKKLSGDLDYELLRHSKTPMTNKELGYCVNDVQVILNYIRECIEDSGNITKIPLTKTGYVRNYTREFCFDSGTTRKERAKLSEGKKYKSLIKSLTMDPEEFKQLQHAFCGGYTHANAVNSGAVFNERIVKGKCIDLRCASRDEASAYPYAMISEKYPMSRCELREDITEETDEFKDLCSAFCCMWYAEFIEISSTFCEQYISKSKCLKCENDVVNNGRIVSADRIITAITNVDLTIIKKVYKYKKMNIRKLRVYDKEYLPKRFILSILKLYEDKTKLKGVKEKEAEYKKAKGYINADYGMTVTNPCKDEELFAIDKWVTQEADIKEAISNYNDSKKRFLFYPWGIWITAYARRNLWAAILELGEDYVYGDTDSAKYTNYDLHEDFFKRYNNACADKLKAMCAFYSIDFELTRPTTIKGKEKPLGVFELEGVYNKFKTLGAKRYMTEVIETDKDGTPLYKIVDITVSGVNKKVAMPYLLDKAGVKYETYKDEENEVTEYRIPIEEDTLPVFDLFNDGLAIPKEHTGKNLHTYIEYETHGKFEDYTGILGGYEEKSAVHLGKTDYTLTISPDYDRYLNEIKKAVRRI